MRTALIWLGVLLAVVCPSSHAAERALHLTASTTTVGRYARIEFTISGLGEYRNPFDPDEADLTLEIRTPRGTAIIVPAFFGQAYERRTREHNGRPADWFYPAGQPRWQARFAPMEVGAYSCAARVKDREGVARSNAVRFRCVPSQSHGFVRVAKQDPRFLAYDDGAPYFAIGQNAAFVKELRDTEAIFAHMAAQGANFARVWASCDDWGMCIEGRKSAWARSWDWRPPFAEEPGSPGRQCVRLAGADGATLAVQPSQPVALRANTRYVVSGSVRSDGSARLSLEFAGARLGEPIASPEKWTPFRRELTTAANQWWLDGLALRLAGGGTVWLRNLSLREAGGGPELLWEADPSRPTMGNYNPVDCFILDKVLEYAEAKGIAIQLVVLTRDLYMSRLKDDKSPAYAAAIADAKRTLRYAVARWGAFTSLAIWEYFNENDPGLPCDRFYTDCGTCLAQIDPYRHLRATSDWGDCPRNWRLSALDVANLHYYLRPADGERFKDEVTTVLERARTLRKDAPRKPALFAEFGLAKDDWQPSPYMEQDAGYIHLHNALWASALSGLSGTVHPWWWEDIEKRGAYRHYRALAAFLKGIPFTSGKLRDASATSSDPRWRVVGLQSGNSAWLWLSDSCATWWQQVVAKAQPGVSSGVAIALEGLPPGMYRLEWWNTGERTVVQTDTARLGDGVLRLTAPDFTSDIACKVTRAREASPTGGTR